MPRNPLHNLLENLLNSCSVLIVFIGLILGTTKIKDRRTPTGLGNSYWGSADSAVFRTHWGVALPESLTCTQRHLPVCREVQGNKKQETVKELRFSWAYVLPAIGSRTSYLN